MLDKKTIREKNKKIRATLIEDGSIKFISEKIVEKIKKELFFIEAKNIMIFHPKNGEIDLLKLPQEHKEKIFYLPRCEGDEIKACPWEIGDELKISKFNIKEPISDEISDLSILDVVFLPALGADLLGNRIGYGGGFYDRFLKNKNLKAKKVVVLAKEMLAEEFEPDVFDVKYDVLITD